MNDPALIEITMQRGGYRLTAARQAVVDTVRLSGNHFTAEQVEAGTPSAGRATVFRTIKLMRDLGIICQVVLDDGAAVYQLAESEVTAHHHHVVCSGCGQVAEFSSPGLEDVLQGAARSTDFEIDTHRLELYGLCPGCRP